MDLQLSGRVAVVTAASRGLGYAVARRFASEGARLVISSDNQETIEAAAARLRGEGADVTAQRCDLTSAEAIRAFVAGIGDRYGRIDAMFVNSGGPRPGGFDEMSDADWQGAFELDVLSVIRLLRDAKPLLQQSDAPAVVNDVSTSVKQPIDGLTLSNVIRASVVTLTKTLSVEWAASGIRVNAIAPGRIATDRVRELDEDSAARLGTTAEDVRTKYIAGIPLGRYGEPDELARVAVFLCSPAASYVQGQFIFVDGGLVKAL